MKYELTQRFYFDAAHTLSREIEAEPSRRIHGHTYVAEVTITGTPDPKTGMVVDLAYLRQAIERVKDMLDHRLLDEVAGLPQPTLEGLCAYIANKMADDRWALEQVTVKREASGDSCTVRDLSSGQQKDSPEP